MSWGEITCENFGDCDFATMTTCCAGTCKHYKMKHEESENCWCDPIVERYENGSCVVIHRDEE